MGCYFLITPWYPGQALHITDAVDISTPMQEATVWMLLMMSAWEDTTQSVLGYCICVSPHATTPSGTPAI